jgi:hypothetical protein
MCPGSTRSQAGPQVCVGSGSELPGHQDSKPAALFRPGFLQDGFDDGLDLVIGHVAAANLYLAPGALPLMLQARTVWPLIYRAVSIKTS